MIEFEEYKGKLHDLHPKLDDLGQSLNIEGAKNELRALPCDAGSAGLLG